MSYGESPETVDYIDYLEAENERLIDENIRLKAQITWRPVSEGLPEIGQRVLYLGNDVDIGKYNGYGEWIDTDGGVLPIQCTTHWLPIPPAPEGK